MSEIDIALKKVYPTLIKKYKINSECIEGYGRVPIQVGQLLVWADYVCYYYRDNKKIPFCVIEVKECDNDSVDFAIPQAESYAQRINAPFFCCTNGNLYNWFMTGNAQGNSLRLEDSPTLPQLNFMKKPDKINISPYLYEAIRNFETNIKKKGKIYEDSLWHNDSTKELNLALKDDNKLKNKNLLLDIIQKNTMESRGKKILSQNLYNNYDKFLRLISWLKNKNVIIDERLEKSIGKHSEYGIENGGFFFITQIISGLFPERFTVIQDNAIKSMLRFKLIDINLKAEEVKEYLYFNKICIDLFPYFENPFRFNLSYVHNFLWHYEKEYFSNGKWD